MDVILHPAKLSGSISAIPSKSQAHRLLICAAFANNKTTILCPETNRDIEATADCLRALGADITRTETGYIVEPVSKLPTCAVLNCCESGSTLRFMLPIAGALGVDATFVMAGRLPQRPLSPLWEEMERMGCRLTRPTENAIRCCGRLKQGEYVIDGGVSSQFITGLLFATSLMGGKSTISVTGRLESKPYVEMTRQALNIFDAPSFHTPGYLEVEGDWSNAAFFLAANALGSSVTVRGLRLDSAQGDKEIINALSRLDAGFCILDAGDIPDLVPILSVAAAAKHGAVFTNIRRLRMKESDRVASVISMIENLGGHAQSDENTLTVSPAVFSGGTVDSVNDHRIAMAAAIASTVCSDDVTILGADCVQKSYPQFWAEYARLGGNYGQYLR